MLLLMIMMVIVHVGVPVRVPSRVPVVMHLDDDGHVCHNYYEMDSCRPQHFGTNFSTQRIHKNNSAAECTHINILSL